LRSLALGLPRAEIDFIDFWPTATASEPQPETPPRKGEGPTHGTLTMQVAALTLLKTMIEVEAAR
jgi:hypothetical protein